MKIQVTREKAEKAVISAMTLISAQQGDPVTELVIRHRMVGDARFEALVDDAFARLLDRHNKTDKGSPTEKHHN